MRTRPTLTAADAHVLAAACRDEAQREGWPVTIAIVDEGGYLLHLERLDARASTVEVATRKARTAAMLHMPSADLEQAARANPGLLALDVLPLRGALPLRWGEVVVGAIGVSGVRGEQDEQVARRGVEQLASLRIEN